MKKNFINKALSCFLILGLVLGLSSCKEEMIKIKTESLNKRNFINESSMVFSGISSIDQISDTTMRINWVANADAISYNIYDDSSGTPILLTNVPGQSSNSFTLTTLAPATHYKLRVRALDSLSRLDINTVLGQATTLNTTPSSLTLITPGSASDVSDIPTVRIAGVRNGDTVKLFSDNTCTTQVATGTSSGTTIDLISSSLPLGLNNLYASAGTSECSTATLAYTRVACATDYVLNNGVCILDFAGVTTITNKTDSTLTLSWVSNASAANYQVDRIISGVSSSFITVAAPASGVDLTGLTPNTAYTFRVRAVDSVPASDVNTATQTVTTNLAPNIPSAVALQTPTVSPSQNSTPLIRVSGVKSGDTVKLFTDSSCTTEVATGTASGSTIDLTTSTLSVGTYTLYANSANSTPNVSSCSTASVGYERSFCPVNYIEIPFNTDVGTTDNFCVAKYEMKCVGSSCPDDPGVNAVAASQPAGAPWVWITQTKAITACSNLNAINGVSSKYHLISNPEWMTIARNVELINTNWTTGTPGSGSIASGWADNGNGGVAPTTDASCLFNNGGNVCGATGTIDKRRTHNLSNGEVIWDFSGNVKEWVNWQVTPANKAHIASYPLNTVTDSVSFKNLDTNIGATDEMKPSTWQSTFLTLDGNNGIGSYYSGSGTYGGAALRGGSLSDGVHTGIYSLHLGTDPTWDNYLTDGFRCVYRPNFVPL